MTTSPRTPTFEHTQWGEDFVLQPNFTGVYANGRPALQLFSADGEPFATITVNLNMALDADEHFIKAYSENQEVVRKMIDLGWLIPTGRTVPSGHVEIPVMRFGGELLDFYNIPIVQEYIAFGRSKIPH